MTRIDHISTYNNLGVIEIAYSKRARRISFRTKNSTLVMVIPHTAPAGHEALCAIIEAHMPALEKLLDKARTRSSSSALYNGKVITTAECAVHLTADTRVGTGRVITKCHNNTIHISYHPDIDIASPTVARRISRHILHLLASQYAHVLRDMVMSYAQEHGLKVNEVRIGSGYRILGHCTRDAVITISSVVLLLPPHLRQYIVCHELAHLTHFNHSPAFHRLCNTYCNANEAIWRKELREWHYPLCL